MATTWEIAEKIRTAYLAIHYHKLVPLASRVNLLSGYSAQQTKLFDTALKKLDAVTKKMEETEAKLSLLGETTGKLLATHNDADLIGLNDALKKQLEAIGKISENRKLVRVYLQKVQLKQIDEAFNELLQQTAQLQGDTDKNLKLNETKVKEALKELTEATDKEAKAKFDKDMVALAAPLGAAPNDAKYDQLLTDLTTQIQDV